MSSFPGAFLALLVGTAASWAVSEEAVNVGLGLYKFNALDANKRFVDWWAARNPE